MTNVTSFLDRGDDGGVAGAAAEMPGEHVHDLLAGRIAAGEQVVGGDQDAGRAEAALERVMALEGLLERREQRIAGERFDRLHLRAVDLDGEHAAGAHRDAVEPHRARSADAVLAADMGSREAQAMAEEVAQEEPRLDLLDDDPPVHGQRDPGHAARSQARSTARSTSVPVRCRR